MTAKVIRIYGGRIVQPVQQRIAVPSEADMSAITAELVDALEQCIEALDQYSDISTVNEDCPNDAMRALMAAKAAIAKARGNQIRERARG